MFIITVHNYRTKVAKAHVFNFYYVTPCTKVNKNLTTQSRRPALLAVSNAPYFFLRISRNITQYDMYFRREPCETPNHCRKCAKALLVLRAISLKLQVCVKTAKTRWVPERAKQPRNANSL